MRITTLARSFQNELLITIFNYLFFKEQSNILEIYYLFFNKKSGRSRFFIENTHTLTNKTNQTFDYFLMTL